MAGDNRSRTVRFVDEPLEGQEKGADGEYLVAEVTHRMRRGYVLHVYHLTRETTVFNGRSLTSESFMLFSSGKQGLVVEDRGSYRRKVLEGLAREGNALFAGYTRPVYEKFRLEVLEAWEREKAEKAEKAQAAAAATQQAQRAQQTQA